MRFVEMTGKQLVDIIEDDEMDVEDLRKTGVEDESIVRINEQGDIELRRLDGWDIIGGLIGDFQNRISKNTGLKWA